MEKKKVIIAIAIALIFTLFIGYGIEVFNDSPQREDFCPERLHDERSEEACLKAGGEWVDEPIRGGPVPVEGGRGFCGPTKECYDNYNQARSQHDKIVFIAAVIFGILGLVAGIILQKESVGIGLLMGGILTIFYGTIRYWRHANDTLKFILLGIVLAVLIWVAIKKLEKK